MVVKYQFNWNCQKFDQLELFDEIYFYIYVFGTQKSTIFAATLKVFITLVAVEVTATFCNVKRLKAMRFRWHIALWIFEIHQGLPVRPNSGEFGCELIIDQARSRQKMQLFWAKPCWATRWFWANEAIQLWAHELQSISRPYPLHCGIFWWYLTEKVRGNGEATMGTSTAPKSPE